MNIPKDLTYYSDKEEKLNIISHAIGIGLSIIGFILLMFKAYTINTFYYKLSFGIFGISMILLYIASTVYHSAKTDKLRHRLNIFDHASIYVLIAGTYTPFALVTLNGRTGWIILLIVWTAAILGVILKLFFTGRYQIFSTIMYIAMGWLIIFAIKPLTEYIEFSGLMWLLAGGISYTIGAIVFSINKIHMNHAIFHVFVLLGTFCHFISVFIYV